MMQIRASFWSALSTYGVVIRLSSVGARATFALIWLALMGYGFHEVVREFRGQAWAALFQDLEGLREALRFIPDAPEVHQNVGTIYLLDPEHFAPAEAVRHFRRAVELSPHDARLWVWLGRAYEATGDRDRAAWAYRRAVALAPAHFRPRFVYANFLLRNSAAGSPAAEEALKHLGALVEATPDIVGNICDLIWQTQGGDSSLLLHLAHGHSFRIRMAVAEYLLTKGRYEEAIALWEELPEWNGEIRTAGLRLVRGMLRARAWEHAQRVWSRWLHREYGEESAQSLWNGSFEHPIAEGGLDWQIASSPEVEARIDETTGYGDARSLALEFRAHEGVRYAGVARVILVQAQTPYVLRFVYKTQAMLSPNGLYVEVADAEDPHRLRVRLQSLAVSEEWTAARLEFLTTATTRAVRVIIGREPIGPLHDFIRGRVWFDAFVLERASHGSDT